MARLAREGGGNFYFIEDARQIPDYFASELGETLDVVARDATFDVATGPGTRVSMLNDSRWTNARAWARASAGRPRVGTGRDAGVRRARRAARRRGYRRRRVPPDRPRGRLGARRAAMPPMRVEWTAAPADVDAAQPVNETRARRGRHAPGRQVPRRRTRGQPPRRLRTGGRGAPRRRRRAPPHGCERRGDRAPGRRARSRDRGVLVPDVRTTHEVGPRRRGLPALEPDGRRQGTANDTGVVSSGRPEALSSATGSHSRTAATARRPVS